MLCAHLQAGNNRPKPGHAKVKERFATELSGNRNTPSMKHVIEIMLGLEMSVW